jgi:hypothetical protein
VTTWPRARRTALLVTVAAGTLALGAGPAAADTVQNQFGSNVRYIDDAGDASTIEVTAAPGQVTISQTNGDTITSIAGNGCPAAVAATITCTDSDISNFELDLGDMDDQATAGGSMGGNMFGNLGVDTLTGSDTNTEFESLNGDDGNDIVNTRNAGPSLLAFLTGDSASGGDGNDLVTTGNGNDFANGDGGGFLAIAAGVPVEVGGDGEPTGADVVSTGTGNDSANGGPGDGDRVDLGEGNDSALVSAGDGNGDVTDGGPGVDRLDAFPMCCGPEPPANFSIDLTAATVQVSAPPGSHSIPNFEDVRSGTGADSVIGTETSNLINTGDTTSFGPDSAESDGPVAGDGIPGPPDAGDTVDPRGGADQVLTGPGNDSISSVDGSQDRLLCGPDTDTVQADQFDQLVECETVTITQTRPAGADTDAPGCRVARVKRSYSRSAFTKGIAVRVTCDEAATLLLRIVATLRGGNNLTAKAGDLVLAERTVSAAANRARGTRLKPAKKLLRRFRKSTGLRARVVVEARDEFGNRSQNVKRLKVKKAKRKRR